MNPERLKWNLNTLLGAATLITAISTIGLTGYTWANTTRDIQDLVEWKTAHESTQRERLAEIKERDGKVDATISNLAQDINAQAKKVDNLEYRVAVSETSMTAMALAQKDMQGSVSDMQGDLKVIREIVTRLDQSNKRAGR